VAKDFGVEEEPVHAAFDPDIANLMRGLSQDDWKTLLRQGPVTKEAIEQLAGGSRRGSRRGGRGQPEGDAE